MSVKVETAIEKLNRLNAEQSKIDQELADLESVKQVRIDELKAQILVLQTELDSLAPKKEFNYKKPINSGVSNKIREFFGEGFDNKATLAKIHEFYGNDNTTIACVSWTRCHDKKLGTEYPITQ